MQKALGKHFPRTKSTNQHNVSDEATDGTTRKETSTAPIARHDLEEPWRLLPIPIATASRTTLKVKSASAKLAHFVEGVIERHGHIPGKVLPARYLRSRKDNSTDREDDEGTRGNRLTGFAALPNEIRAQILPYVDIDGLCALRLTSKNLYAHSEELFPAQFTTIALYMGKAALLKLVKFATSSPFATLVRQLVIVDWRLCSPAVIYKCMQLALSKMVNCKRIVIQSTHGPYHNRTEFTVQFGLYTSESLHRMMFPRSPKHRAHILPMVLAATHDTGVRSFHYASPIFFGNSNKTLHSAIAVTHDAMRRMWPLVPPAGLNLDRFTIAMCAAPKATFALAALLIRLPRLRTLVIDIERQPLVRLPFYTYDDLTLVIAAIDCPALVSLIIYTRTRLPDVELVDLLSRHAATLKCLTLGHLSFWAAWEPSTVFNAIRRLPRLVHLTLDHLANASHTLPTVGPMLFKRPEDLYHWDSARSLRELGLPSKEGLLKLRCKTPVELQKAFEERIAHVCTLIEKKRTFTFETLYGQTTSVDKPKRLPDVVVPSGAQDSEDLLGIEI